MKQLRETREGEREGAPDVEVEVDIDVEEEEEEEEEEAEDAEMLSTTTECDRMLAVTPP